ncbi:MAG: efflux RND transporter periplasmic adaptor subunit [Sandaracinaceae bacterium]|nr:efflux RND transporter periplasmic adaptor subunit [Sandaracinaceae bacterium]
MSTPENSSSTREADPDVIRTLGMAKKSGARKWIVRLLILAAAGALIFGAVVYFKKARLASAPTYTYVQARRSDVTVVVTATGTLRAMNTVQVGTEVSGRVQSVNVNFNDRVVRGQVLVELDPEQLRARVNEATANLALARAAVQQAQATLAEANQSAARIERLAAQHIASQADLDTARAALARGNAALASARAQERVAQANVSSAQTQLAKSIIHSPIDGVVLDRTVEPGQTVNGSFQTPVLLTLAEDITRMELHVDVDEADVGRVHEGQAATFTVAAYPGRSFSSRLVELRNAARSVQNVVSYEGVLLVDNQERLLRPGMTATVSIVADRHADVLVVPNAALRFVPTGFDMEEVRKRLGSDRHVWVARNGQPVAVAVQTGVSDGRVTEVRSGAVTAGMQLIVDVRRAP